MRAIFRRIRTLEQRGGVVDGVDYSKPLHVIIMGEEQPHREAVEEYRAKHPDKPVEPDHNVMWIQLVSPKLDEEGNMIPETKESGNDGPTLAEVLAQA